VTVHHATSVLYHGLIRRIDRAAREDFHRRIQSMPKGAVLWLFVFVVYGSTMALAFFLVRDSFTVSRDHWVKFPLAWNALFVFTFATAIVWGFGVDTLHIIPPKKLPLRSHPFW
jgi:hypothetical protein